MKMQEFNFVDFLGRYTDEPEESLMIFEIEEVLPRIGAGVWIAGGALRKTLQGVAIDTDVDLFFDSRETLNQYRSELKDLGAQLISKNKHQESYNLYIEALEQDVKVQLVIIDFYKNVHDLLDSFDFTITQLAYDGDKLYTGPYTLWDLSRKRLAIHKITYGVASLRRLIKYSRQGFTACAGVMTNFLTIIAENPELIRSDIKYVD